MSWEATKVVWETSKARGGAFLVLLTLADHVSENAGCAWPSIPRIAERARLSPRQVHRLIRQLQDLGEITVTRDGKRRSNQYVLTLRCSDNSSGVTIRQDDMGDTPECHGVREGVTFPALTGDTGVTRTKALRKNIQRTPRLRSRGSAPATREDQSEKQIGGGENGLTPTQRRILLDREETRKRLEQKAQAG